MTVPPPAGVAHVPSPRQKVEDEAEVPLFRWLTPRFPVTSAVDKSIALTLYVTTLEEFDQCGMPVAAMLGNTTR